MKNSHSHKAESYEIGRPEYPFEFFEYLYNEAGFEKNSVIADIGAGTGKVTKGFLKKAARFMPLSPIKI